LSSNTLVTGGFDDDYKEVILTPTAAAAGTLTHDHMTEEETSGVQEMLQALAQEEIDAFADEHMPLRHLRAEKVRYLITSQSMLRVCVLFFPLEVSSLINDAYPTGCYSVGKY
jgi:hypothetical protein